MSYTVQRIDEADTEDVMKLLKKTFYIDEPLNQAVGYCTSVGDDTEDLDGYCRSILPGVSFKAVDDAGNIVGVLVNDIHDVHSPMDYEDLIQHCTNDKFIKILHVLKIREMGAKENLKYPANEKLLEIKLAATDHAWRNKGIMNKLMAETEKASREFGLRLIRIDTSSEFSAKAAEKFGFKCIYENAYSNIKRNGVAIIVPDPPHLYDRVFIKELL